MKTIHALALITVGAALIDSMPLRASEAGDRAELVANKSQVSESLLSYGGIKFEEQPGAQANQQAGGRFQDEVGARLTPQARPEAATQSAPVYSPKIELAARKPYNVVQSVTHPGMEYSGILVQLTRDNPLQLINPFAPALYGDGHANTSCDVITGRAEGLKVLGISF